MPTAVDQVSQVDVTEIKKTFSSLTLEKAIPALIVLAVGIVAVFLLTKLFDRLMSRTQLEKSLSGFLRSLIRILLYVIVVLVALGTLGLNVSSLVAILSVASLAITLAIQGTLSNIAGGIQVLTAATVLGLYEDGVVTVLHDDKHLKYRPQKLIVATGASEKFLAFPGNDLPGIYGAGAVQTLMNVSGVKPAERVVMVGAGNIGLIVSYQLLQAGVDVACVVEAAPQIGGYLVHASKLARSGVPIRTGWTVKEAFGEETLEGVVLVQLDESFQQIPGTEETVACDALCLAVGLSPLADLLYQADCAMTYVRELSGAVPVVDENLMTSVEGIYVCGDVSGIEEASAAMVEGRLAGCAAAKALGWNAEAAQAEIENAQVEVSELRSGPTGARIRAGLAKMKGKRGAGAC